MKTKKIENIMECNDRNQHFVSETKKKIPLSKSLLLIHQTCLIQKPKYQLLKEKNMSDMVELMSQQIILERSLYQILLFLKNKALFYKRKTRQDLTQYLYENFPMQRDYLNCLDFFSFKATIKDELEDRKKRLLQINKDIHEEGHKKKIIDEMIEYCDKIIKGTEYVAYRKYQFGQTLALEKYIEELSEEDIFSINLETELKRLQKRRDNNDSKTKRNL